VQRPAVTRHLKNIFESGELTEETTSSILEHMAPHRQTYQTKYYRTCWAKVSHEGRWHDRRTAVSLPQLLCGSGRVSRTRTALCPNTL
jgi:hypothetical protein